MSPAPRTDAQVLGEAITILRGHAQLDQAGVAALLGCEPDHMRLYEAGGGTLEEKAQVLAGLAAALGLRMVRRAGR